MTAEPTNVVDMRDHLRHQLGLLTEEQVAGMLEVSTHTLKIWRIEKKGPAYTKLGRQIFYQLQHIHDWVQSSTIRHEPTVAAG